MAGFGGSGQWVRARREEDAQLLVEERGRSTPLRKRRTRRQRRLFAAAIGLLAAAAFLGPLAFRLFG